MYLGLDAELQTSKIYAEHAVPDKNQKQYSGFQTTVLHFEIDLTEKN